MVYRLVCWLFGHRWTAWTTAYEIWRTNGKSCLRCGAEVWAEE